MIASKCPLVWGVSFVKVKSAKSVPNAIKFANKCASKVVSQKGVSVM